MKKLNRKEIEEKCKYQRTLISINSINFVLTLFLVVLDFRAIAFTIMIGLLIILGQVDLRYYNLIQEIGKRK